MQRLLSTDKVQSGSANFGGGAIVSALLLLVVLVISPFIGAVTERAR